MAKQIYRHAGVAVSTCKLYCYDGEFPVCTNRKMIVLTTNKNNNNNIDINIYKYCYRIGIITTKPHETN